MIVGVNQASSSPVNENSIRGALEDRIAIQRWEDEGGLSLVLEGSIAGGQASIEQSAEHHHEHGVRP
jgi:hypothetical protein